MEKWLVFTYIRGDLFKVSVCRTKRMATRLDNQNTKPLMAAYGWSSKVLPLSFINAYLTGVDPNRLSHRKALATVQ